MRLLIAAALLVVGCRSRGVTGAERDWYAGGSFSAIPAVGLAAEAGRVLHRGESFDLAVEGEFTWQFLTDQDLADDGRSANTNNWTQLRLGLKQSFQPTGKRHLVLRYGLVGFRATGTPGIIDSAGDYLGAYGGLGFEADLGDRWVMGPEVRVLAVDGLDGGGFEVIPQFAWHLAFRF